ncbi:MAG: hypothetical protein IK088_03155, partial [Lachnospiraceae bacterium]|nr:hypothetical protein [Lachnospiraceae bacterium]
SAVLMMLHRNNGVYAFLIFAAFGALILYLKKRNETRFFLYCLLAVLLYGTLNRGLLLATNATDVGHREILTVPIQQMARVYAYDSGSLIEEEKSAIERYVPKIALEKYNPKCSDGVKILFQENEYLKDKKEFYLLWLKLFAKHPAAYLNAWVMTSYGLYYPGAVIDGYAGNEVYTFVYGESSYFGYETEPPGERHSLIPAIDRFYRFLSLDPKIQRIPVLRLLFAPGFLLWVYLYFAGFLIYCGRYETALPYILPLCVVFTCLFGPMSLVRYVWYLWIFAPVIVYEALTAGDGTVSSAGPGAGRKAEEIVPAGPA